MNWRALVLALGVAGCGGSGLESLPPVDEIDRPVVLGAGGCAPVETEAAAEAMTPTDCAADADARALARIRLRSGEDALFVVYRHGVCWDVIVGEEPVVECNRCPGACVSLKTSDDAAILAGAVDADADELRLTRGGTVTRYALSGRALPGLEGRRLLLMELPEGATDWRIVSSP